MKCLILYQSKYGATKKYVQMLQQELTCDICDIKNYETVKAGKYDWILFAGGIYAGRIAGIDTLKKIYNRLNRQRLAILCVGGSPSDEKTLDEIKANNLKDGLENTSVFYGRGVWDESKMNWKDRTLCKMLRKFVAKNDPDSWLCAVGEKQDWTDRKYLIPLLDFIKSEA